LAELPAPAPGAGILPGQRRSGTESTPPSGLRDSMLPIGNVHRDFEAKTDLRSSRGLPFHGVHGDYSCV
jgi:hypothetical protein